GAARRPRPRPGRLLAHAGCPAHAGGASGRGPARRRAGPRDALSRPRPPGPAAAGARAGAGGRDVPGLTFRPLSAEDEPVVRPWLLAYVAEHEAWWRVARGLEPGTGAMDEQREWDDLLATGPAKLADVLVEGGAPAGVVMA